MARITRFVRLWQNLFFRKHVEAELDAELRAVLDLMVDERTNAGEPKEEAIRAAGVEMGQMESVKDSVREVRMGFRVETLLRDLRYAARGLWRQPGFTFPAIGSFAMGLGAATAIFSVAYGIALRPLPYRDPDRLVRIYESNIGTGESQLLVSEGTFQAWRESDLSLENIARFGPPRVRYTPGDVPQPITTMLVSPRFFDVLRVTPLVGRGFREESEYGRGKQNELLISYAAWQRFFNGDPTVIGQAVSLIDGNDPSVIAGVMPPDFSFDDSVDVWLAAATPVPISPARRSMREDRVIARLQSSQTLAGLQARLSVVSTRLASEFPSTNGSWGASAQTLRDDTIGRFGQASWFLIVAVLGILAASCANVAGMISSHRVNRANETNIRLALGAGWARLVQLWLAEVLLLASIGGTAGMLMAIGLIRLLRVAAPPGLPRLESISVDLLVLSVAFLTALIAAIIATLIPLVDIGVRNGATLLRGSERAGRSKAQRNTMTAFVAVQCGSALALVIISMAFGRSFLALTAVNLGWQPERLLSLHLNPPRSPQGQNRQAFYADWAERLVARLEAAPGVARATITSGIPFSDAKVQAEIARGASPEKDEVRWPVELNSVLPNYFDVLGIPLREGRLLTRDDRTSVATPPQGQEEVAPSAAVVSETVATALWPGQRIIGQRFRIPGFPGRIYEVVGVVNNVQFTTIGDDSSLEIFVPWFQMPMVNAARLIVSADHDAAAIAPLVRSQIVGLYKNTGIDRVAVVSSLVDQAMAPVRLTSQVVAALGIMALVLSGLGAYGALSTVVAASRRELAVRAALGASPSATLYRTIRIGVTPVVWGLLGGTAVSLVLLRAASSVLFGMTSVDIFSISAAGLAIVFLVTVTGCIGPALRAARTAPSTVLRS